MHPNPVFRKTEQARSLAFARERAFGTLCINGDEGPLLSHIPFRIDEGGGFVEAHLVRSNPIVRALKMQSLPAVLSIVGEDGYISPDWYVEDGAVVPDQVPTWNYVAVHVRGSMRLSDQDGLHGVLSRLSADHEERLAPKRPWTSDKMDQDVYAKMQRAIVPIAMTIERVDSTWKLSQNKPGAVRHAAADCVAARGQTALADLMRNAGDG
ncbi:MAG: FMN-binding negative transcriptional regulator [Devosiaceae bacterium]|nr:FMN-binding negative transcriptional regulator [Devosiaceae bacterium MH13]